MNRKSIALKIAAISAIPVSILACNKNEPAEEGLQGEEITEAKAAMEYDLEKDFEAQELLNQFAITTLSEEEPATYEITAGLVLDEAEPYIRTIGIPATDNPEGIFNEYVSGACGDLSRITEENGKKVFRTLGDSCSISFTPAPSADIMGVIDVDIPAISKQLERIEIINMENWSSNWPEGAISQLSMWQHPTDGLKYVCISDMASKTDKGIMIAFGDENYYKKESFKNCKYKVGTCTTQYLKTFIDLLNDPDNKNIADMIVKEYGHSPNFDGYWEFDIDFTVSKKKWYPFCYWKRITYHNVRIQNRKITSDRKITFDTDNYSSYDYNTSGAHIMTFTAQTDFSKWKQILQ